MYCKPYGALLFHHKVHSACKVTENLQPKQIYFNCNSATALNINIFIHYYSALLEFLL